jgi:Fungal specific transcription factor domain
MYSGPIVPTLDPVSLGSETLAVAPAVSKYPVPLDFLRPVETSRGNLTLYPPPVAHLPVDASPGGLVSAYYGFFHPAHPFLLPQLQMVEYLKDPKHRHLELAMLYIGSFYTVTTGPAVYEQSLASMLHQAYVTNNKSASVVQAMLLYAIGLHMNNKEEDSTRVLCDAIGLAFEIGLHLPSYSALLGVVGTTLEESYRRTFWELYVVDGLFAGVNAAHSLQLNRHDVTDYLLPMEDTDYYSGVCIPRFRH